MNAGGEIETSIKIWDLFFKIVIPIFTFIAGVLVSRFSMTKKESKDFKAKQQETANSMNSSLNECFQKYTAAIQEYINSEEGASFSTFYSIATTGEGYFSQLRMICDSILSGNISKTSAELTFAKIVSDVYIRTIPKHYKILKSIADKQNYKYDGILDFDNYKSIVEVHKKYNA